MKTAVFWPNAVFRLCLWCNIDLWMYSTRGFKKKNIVWRIGYNLNSYIAIYCYICSYIVGQRRICQGERTMSGNEFSGSLCQLTAVSHGKSRWPNPTKNNLITKILRNPAQSSSRLTVYRSKRGDVRRLEKMPITSFVINRAIGVRRRLLRCYPSYSPPHVNCRMRLAGKCERSKGFQSVGRTTTFLVVVSISLAYAKIRDRESHKLDVFLERKGVGHSVGGRSIFL